MAIGAHPDDVELNCAGTLARCAQRGDKITICIACKGDSASLDLPSEDLVKIRSSEARASAQILEAEVIEMGLGDYCVDVNLDTKRLFSNAIRQANPDVVLTHFHTDYGSDHNNTFVLVRDATLAATVPRSTTSRPAIPRMLFIYMWDPCGGYGFQPEIYVDITETMETKVKMLNCHRSQIEWSKRHGGTDFVDFIQTVAKYRGYQSGVKMAEGFIALKNSSNIRAGAVLP
ncbi:MAG: PIG-L deacetylase family protein [Terriglobia bacterium]|jgi:LmbE family N-acetylglucosaminyl deacetylase